MASKMHYSGMRPGHWQSDTISELQYLNEISDSSVAPYTQIHDDVENTSDETRDLCLRRRRVDNAQAQLACYDAPFMRIM